MPITPLHFGVLAPINHLAPGKVSNVSFILVNLWLDWNAIQHWLFNLPLSDHGPSTHSFMGALYGGTLVAVFALRTKSPYISLPWVYGAYLGAFMHILLDMLVHSEMLPFYPLDSITSNPFYMGWMEPLSILLVPLVIWLIYQYVRLITKKVANMWALYN